MIRSYDELCRFDNLLDRYRYLKEYAEIGLEQRWLGQAFYTSREWRQVRQAVIARDRGCDLGIPGREVSRSIVVHHMNPIKARDLTRHDSSILDPKYLISVSLRTHNAIHFGTEDQLELPLVVRRPGDTRLW